MQDSWKNTPRSPVTVDGIGWSSLGFCTLNVAGLTKMLQLSKRNFWTKFGYIYFGSILFVPTQGEDLRIVTFEDNESRCLLLQTAE